MKKFKEKFKIEEFEIKKLNYWIISLRPQQVTLGCLVLSLNRKCRHFGDLTEQEGREMSEAFRVVEELLETAFKPDKINYLALMMIDNQVHFHVVPRYENKVDFDGQTYKDVDWPTPPNVLTFLLLDNEKLKKLHQHLIEPL